MGYATRGRSWSAQALIGFATIAALVPSAWAYVNGGDFHSTLRDYESKLRSNGYGVRVGRALAPDCDKTGEVTRDVKVTPPDNAEYQDYTNQMVARAIRCLPDDEAKEISAEARREVARQARAAIAEGVSNKRAVNKTGRLGRVSYQVGVYSYQTWWETNYGGKREIHARQSALAPFVAVMVEEEE
jgi:hypothetical protein